MITILIAISYLCVPKITAGQASFSNGMSADFLTSSFGGRLPLESLPVIDLEKVVSDSTLATACSPISKEVSRHLNSHFALLVRRGGCRFDLKVLNAQQAGARVVILYDPEDRALQRIGGLHPTEGYVDIPAIIIPLSAAVSVQSSEKTVFVSLTPASDDTLSSKWIDVAYIVWEEDLSNRLIQLEGLIQKYSKD